MADNNPQTFTVKAVTPKRTYVYFAVDGGELQVERNAETDQIKVGDTIHATISGKGVLKPTKPVKATLSAAPVQSATPVPVRDTD